MAIFVCLFCAVDVRVFLSAAAAVAMFTRTSGFRAIFHRTLALADRDRSISVAFFSRLSISPSRTAIRSSSGSFVTKSGVVLISKP